MNKKVRETARYKMAKAAVKTLDDKRAKLRTESRDLDYSRHLAYREMRAALKEAREIQRRNQ